MFPFFEPSLIAYSDIPAGDFPAIMRFQISYARMLFNCLFTCVSGTVQNALCGHLLTQVRLFCLHLRRHHAFQPRTIMIICAGELTVGTNQLCSQLLTVEEAVAGGFDKMGHADVGGAGKVGDGACDLDDAEIGTHRKARGAHQTGHHLTAFF